MGRSGCWDRSGSSISRRVPAKCHRFRKTEEMDACVQVLNTLDGVLATLRAELAAAREAARMQAHDADPSRAKKIPDYRAVKMIQICPKARRLIHAGECATETTKTLIERGKTSTKHRILYNRMERQSREYILHCTMWCSQEGNGRTYKGRNRVSTRYQGQGESKDQNCKYLALCSADRDHLHPNKSPPDDNDNALDSSKPCRS